MRACRPSAARADLKYTFYDWRVTNALHDYTLCCYLCYSDNALCPTNLTGIILSAVQQVHAMHGTSVLLTRVYAYDTLVDTTGLY